MHTKQSSFSLQIGYSRYIDIHGQHKKYNWWGRNYSTCGGGAAFTFSQQDVIDNFSNETGLTQEQAAQYINEIPEEELVSFDELGADYVSESQVTFDLANEIDCVNYEYEWESPTLTCSVAKAQLNQLGNSERSLGQAYIKLSADTASESDIRTVIRYLD